MSTTAHPATFPQTLRRIVERHSTLDRDEARALMQSILAPEAQLQDVQIAALLAALAVRGETAAELAGFADAMRLAVTPIPLDDFERITLVDTCGTGGDGSNTFNISTAAALVAAAAGARVAKHGNRSITSRSGSADVLEALGIATDLPPAAAAECLRATGFAFLYAPSLHPATRRVQPIRRALGIRTVFNLLGPLTNPAAAPAQVMGVYSAELVPLVAAAMALLGTRHGFVVHGSANFIPGQLNAGLDEISISGETTIAEVIDGSVHPFFFTPEEAGIARAPISTLAGGDATENAAILRSIFDGESGPRRDVVVLNAAAAIAAAGLAPNLIAGIPLAAAAIDTGAVNRTLAALIDFSRSALKPSA